MGYTQLKQPSSLQPIPFAAPCSMEKRAHDASASTSICDGSMCQVNAVTTSNSVFETLVQVEVTNARAASDVLVQRRVATTLKNLLCPRSMFSA
jgi:hypothetical protein